MKLLPILLLGGVALAAYFFWNPTICSTLNQIPGLDKFDFCNLGHGGIINHQDIHDRTNVIHHQAGIQHHLHAAERKIAHMTRPPSMSPTSDTIGVPSIGGAGAIAAGIGSQIPAKSHMAEQYHHRMSI